MMTPEKRLMSFEALQLSCIAVDHQYSGDMWCKEHEHPDHGPHTVANCDAEDCPVWNGLRKSTKAREDTLIELRAATMHAVDCCGLCKHCRVPPICENAFECVLIKDKPWPCEPDDKCGVFESP